MCPHDNSSNFTAAFARLQMVWEPHLHRSRSLGIQRLDTRAFLPTPQPGLCCAAGDCSARATGENPCAHPTCPSITWQQKRALFHCGGFRITAWPGTEHRMLSHQEPHFQTQITFCLNRLQALRTCSSSPAASASVAKFTALLDCPCFLLDAFSLLASVRTTVLLDTGCTVTVLTTAALGPCVKFSMALLEFGGRLDRP